jgi:hypothetical protein
LFGVSADRVACWRMCGLHSTVVAAAGDEGPRRTTRASRVFRYLLAALLLSVDAGMLLSWWLARRPPPHLDGSVASGGLTDGVIVDRNAWGRRWIRAKSLQDLVTVEGYVMAQDRCRRWICCGGRPAEILEFDTIGRARGWLGGSRGTAVRLGWVVPGKSPNRTLTQPAEVRDCCNKIIAIESGWLLQWCEICSAHRSRRTRQNESAE